MCGEVAVEGEKVVARDGSPVREVNDIILAFDEDAGGEGGMMTA